MQTSPLPPSPGHADVQQHALTTAAEAELAEIQRKAAEAAEQAKAKMRQAAAQQAEFHRLIEAGKAAWEKLQNARDQVGILTARRAVAAGKFDILIGGDALTTSWHRDLKIDPLVDSHVYGPTHQFPFIFHSHTMAAIDLAAARIQAAIPALEQAEAEARTAAEDFARREGFEHPLAGTPPAAPEAPTAPETSDTSVVPVAPEPERYPGKRKATR